MNHKASVKTTFHISCSSDSHLHLTQVLLSSCFHYFDIIIVVLWLIVNRTTWERMNYGLSSREETSSRYWSPFQALMRREPGWWSGFPANAIIKPKPAAWICFTTETDHSRITDDMKSRKMCFLCSWIPESSEEARIPNMDTQPHPSVSFVTATVGNANGK